MKTVHLALVKVILISTIRELNKIKNILHRKIANLKFNRTTL